MRHTDPDTRHRLLHAAMRAFGQRDYDSVSTRQIVEAAGANISAITYHFGGKQGLYLATAEHIAQTLNNLMQPLLQQIDAQSATASPEQCRRLLHQVIANMLNMLLGHGIGEDASGFILREQQRPSAAFDTLYQHFMLPMQSRFALLVGRIRSSDPGSRENLLITHALMGQILMFRVARSTLLRRLDQSTLEPSDIQQIIALVSALSTAALAFDTADSSTGEQP